MSTWTDDDIYDQKERDGSEVDQAAEMAAHELRALLGPGAKVFPMAAGRSAADEWVASVSVEFNGMRVWQEIRCRDEQSSLDLRLNARNAARRLAKQVG